MRFSIRLSKVLEYETTIEQASQWKMRFNLKLFSSKLQAKTANYLYSVCIYKCILVTMPDCRSDLGYNKILLRVAARYHTSKQNCDYSDHQAKRASSLFILFSAF